jgi:hypothetical protein
MLQTNTFAKHSQMKNIGGKIVSFLNYPLFTIPFSKREREKRQIEKKSEMVKTATPKKTSEQVLSHTKQVKETYKPVQVRNTSPRRNGKSHIFSRISNREEYERIRFIMRACDKSDGRAFTNVLHVEGTENGSHLIGTDGKRMHVVEIGTKIKPGDYKPVINENTITLGKPITKIYFPDWKRVVPTNVIRRGFINLDDSIVGKNSRVCDSITKLTGEKINRDHLADLTKKTWAVFSCKEKRKALLLKEFGAKKETYAVIMPLAS